ncbi:hypothetical protein AB6A40_009691 [Gnathostoma spinigerum]|uniref:Uncharacterized protein n=1 Tax=Gnathostoma spinigerum TaxID=75299 RepID=A0ABD6F142_9BILA
MFRPFPSLPRLHRHIKEKHLSGSAKSIFPNQKSRNFISSQTQMSTSTVAANTAYVTIQPSHLQQQQSQSQQQTPAHMVNGQQQGNQAYSVSQPSSSYLAQVVPSTHQIVANGYVNGTPTAVAVAQTAFVAAPVQTLIHTNTSHSYHPYQQNFKGGNSSQHITMTSPQQHSNGPVIQSVQYCVPSTSHAIGDPGRTVVQAPKPIEPVFVAPPNSVQVKRVMHSEVYLRYIESLSNGPQRTVSKWNKNLGATSRNTPPPQKTLPTHWLKGAKEGGASEEEVVRALWKLRDHLLENTLNIAREVDLVGPL